MISKLMFYLVLNVAQPLLLHGLLVKESPAKWRSGSVQGS